MTLNQRDFSILSRTRRANVEHALAGLGKFMKKNSWVGQQNRYSVDTVAKLKSEVRAGRIQNPAQLSEYIAASCLLHCSDGWSFLGRALGALLRGDPHRARHLAYYAELRAATSLLATEGIGIFNWDHFAITGPGVATALMTKKGTHVFAWECLEYWATQNASGNLFAQLFRPYGISLENWYAPIGGAASLAPQAQAWFKQWGIDLSIFPDDHRARNVSSYQPDGVPTTWTTDGHETINFVKNLWESLEPSSACRFETIDRHVLRLSLEATFHGRTGKTASKAQPAFMQFVTPVVKHQGLSPEMESQWLSFIARKIAPKDLDLFSFSQKLPVPFADSHFSVVSRAVLLLRAASGSTTRLFQAANHSINSFEFWWEEMGHTRGLWDGARESDDLLNLWIDIRDCLTDVEAFQNKFTKDDQTFFKLGKEAGAALVGLSSCERVALWSMAP